MKYLLKKYQMFIFGSAHAFDIWVVIMFSKISAWIQQFLSGEGVL